MNYSKIFVNVPKEPLDDNFKDFFEDFSFITNDFGKQINNPLNSCCDDRIIGDFELIYIVDGISYITINNKKYICQAGDMVLIPPFIKHKIETSKINPHHNYWIHFDVNPFYKQQDFISLLLSENEYITKIGLQNELLSLYYFFRKRAFR
jgi:hypothetical protein